MGAAPQAVCMRYFPVPHPLGQAAAVQIGRPADLSVSTSRPAQPAVGRCGSSPALRRPMSSRKSSPTWTRKRLSAKPRGGRRAGRRPSGGCSTDLDHPKNTTLVCDASGAATVAAGPRAGARRNARRRTPRRGGFGRRDATQRRLANAGDRRTQVPTPVWRHCWPPKRWFILPSAAFGRNQV